MVATEVRIRRGTNSQHSSFTGAQGELTYVTDLKELRIHDGSTVGGLATAFQAGTVMLFHQSAAPIGWTKITAGTLNNHAMRIVTSTGWSSGSSGSTGFSSVFGSGKVSGSHVLTTDELAAHSHVQQKFSTGGGGVSGTISTNSATPVSIVVPTQNAGIGSGHTHTLSLDLNYANMILATKD